MRRNNEYRNRVKMWDRIIEKIIENIKLEVENSPILFVWENEELVNKKVESICLELLKKLGVPPSYLFKLEDDKKNIKLAGIKEFLSRANTKPWYKVQIFLIENFSRATIGALNSCLKIFEEPWIYNIFFFTNKSESGSSRYDFIKKPSGKYIIPKTRNKKWFFL